MRFIAAIIAVLLLTPASAQEVPPPQKFTLEVDQNDLNSISAAINELPKRIADPLIQRLAAQVQAQAAARAKADADKAAAAKEAK